MPLLTSRVATLFAECWLLFRLWFYPEATIQLTCSDAAEAQTMVEYIVTNFVPEDLVNCSSLLACHGRIWFDLMGLLKERATNLASWVTTKLACSTPKESAICLCLLSILSPTYVPRITDNVYRCVSKAALCSQSALCALETRLQEGELSECPEELKAISSFVNKMKGKGSAETFPAQPIANPASSCVSCRRDGDGQVEGAVRAHLSALNHSDSDG
jgi:hypothetical protein